MVGYICVKNSLTDIGVSSTWMNLYPAKVILGPEFYTILSGAKKRTANNDYRISDRKAADKQCASLMLSEDDCCNDEIDIAE